MVGYYGSSTRAAERLHKTPSPATVAMDMDAQSQRSKYSSSATAAVTTTTQTQPSPASAFGSSSSSRQQPQQQNQRYSTNNSSSGVTPMDIAAGQDKSGRRSSSRDGRRSSRSSRNKQQSSSSSSSHHISGGSHTAIQYQQQQPPPGSTSSNNNSRSQRMMAASPHGAVAPPQGGFGVQPPMNSNPNAFNPKHGMTTPSPHDHHHHSHSQHNHPSHHHSSSGMQPSFPPPAVTNDSPTQVQGTDATNGSQRRPAYLLHRDLVIGKGSYGQVCIASRGEPEGHQSSRSGKRKKFACKCVLLRNDPKYIAKLQEEVNVLRELRGHDNVIRLYDVFCVDNELFIITELGRGGDLFHLLTTHPKHGVTESYAGT